MIHLLILDRSLAEWTLHGADESLAIVELCLQIEHLRLGLALPLVETQHLLIDGEPGDLSSLAANLDL